MRKMTEPAAQKSGTENGGGASAEKHEHHDDLSDAQALLPHLESLERIIKLPVVGAAWDKSQDVYGKVKGQNRVFNWAFNAAEDCVIRAVTTAAPIINRLDQPIQYVDQTLVKGISQLEVRAPIIKDTPHEIYHQTITKVIDCVQPHIERVAKLKSAGHEKSSLLRDLAWHKANEILATQYGRLAVSGVDSTSDIAERLLEYYFPKSESDTEEDDDERIAAIDEDPVLHSVQTVGRLSNKISRCFYHNVNKQLKHVQNGNITDYMSSLIAALKLHQYLNFINASMVVEQDVTCNDSGGGAGGPTCSTTAAAASKHNDEGDYQVSSVNSPDAVRESTATRNKKKPHITASVNKSTST